MVGVVSKFRNTLEVRSGRHVCAEWARGAGKNWGDNLNPYLVQKLSDKPVLHARDTFSSLSRDVYGVIGSWLASTRYSNLVVWGLGFLRHSDKLTANSQRICAVRGPKSLLKVRNSGYTDSVAVGDPALLIPLLHKLKPAEQKCIGVIPHYRDRGHPVFDQLHEMDGYKIIDVCADTEDFCDQLATCKAVVSSSLHAVVSAHAYKIPARFIKVSDNPLGDGFKLLDYLESVGLNDCPPVSCTSVEHILASVDTACLPRHFPNLEELLSVCPFMSSSQKRELQQLANLYYRV